MEDLRSSFNNWRCQFNANWPIPENSLQCQHFHWALVAIHPKLTPPKWFKWLISILPIDMYRFTYFLGSTYLQLIEPSSKKINARANFLVFIMELDLTLIINRWLVLKIRKFTWGLFYNSIFSSVLLPCCFCTLTQVPFKQSIKRWNLSNSSQFTICFSLGNLPASSCLSPIFLSHACKQIQMLVVSEVELSFWLGGLNGQMGWSQEEIVSVNLEQSIFCDIIMKELVQMKCFFSS